MSSATNPLPAPDGPGSVTGAPDLPAGFADTFTSRYVDAGDVRLQAVVRGDGPPLLLVHGWPETWYAWRLLMPALARDFQVVAVHQRGIGLSDKPEDGYDTATLAGVSPPAPLFLPDQVKARLWHIPFNQQDTVNEQLVTGREGIFLGAEFSASAGKEKLPDDAVRYYVDTLATSPEHLRGSFQMYRAFNASATQNEQRANTRLTMPVLALLDTGHWIAEQAPDQMLRRSPASCPRRGCPREHLPPGRDQAAVPDHRRAERRRSTAALGAS